MTDGDITQVATLLLDAGIPVIIQSGVGIGPELALRFPDLVVYIKPYVAADLVSEPASLTVAKRLDCSSIGGWQMATPEHP